MESVEVLVQRCRARVAGEIAAFLQNATVGSGRCRGAERFGAVMAGERREMGRDEEMATLGSTVVHLCA
jgi:hypothetical protein